MDQIKANLKGVVGSSKCGIPLSSLQNEYFTITNSKLNYQDFDYSDLQSFLQSMTDIVKLQKNGNNWHVYLVTTENDDPSLKNLCNLIQNTKGKKKQKSNRNIPKNIIEKAGFNKLKISVPNELYKNDTNMKMVLSSKGIQNNNKIEEVKGFSKLNISEPNEFCKYKNNFGHSTPSEKNQDHKYNLKNNSGFNSPIKISSPDSSHHKENKYTLEKSLSSISKNEKDNRDNNYMKSYKHNLLKQRDNFNIGGSNSYNTFYTENMSINNNGTDIRILSEMMWPLKFDISINILQKPIRIFGIQSGYALVSLLEDNRESYYLEAKLSSKETPGDILLWQPPILDINRSKTAFDSSSAFLVILLDIFNNDFVKVRIMGLNVCLEIKRCQLFELPKNIEVANKFRSDFLCRRLTFIRLAYIPTFLDMWDPNLIYDIHFCPVIINSDEYIVESCENRGNFLNIVLLLNMTKYHYQPELSLARVRAFNWRMSDLLDICKKGMLSIYEDMLCNKDNDEKNTELRMLLPVDRECVSLERKMLIGSPEMLSKRKSRITDYNFSYIDLTIERIIYRFETRTFHYFDKGFAEVNIEKHYPIYGLYIINEKFINSRIAQIAKVRFQGAVLTNVPDCKKYENN